MHDHRATLRVHFGRAPSRILEELEVRTMLITAQDAADRLNIKLQRFYELVRKGTFPPGVIVRFGTRQIRVHEGRLEEWVSAGGDYGASDPTGGETE
jgi:excisionase family DNA binding protein